MVGASNKKIGMPQSHRKERGSPLLLLFVVEVDVGLVATFCRRCSSSTQDICRKL